MSEERSAAGQSPDLASLSLAITEHAPLPMATVEGATYIVRYANPAFCRLMDAPMEQLVGKPLSELLPERDECVTLLDRVFRTGISECHTEQDGSKPHSVFWSYTMWPVLADEALVGIMIQVTETVQFHKTTHAINEALVLGSVRQHELTEAAETLNAQMRAELDEREHTEEALRESAERYRSLFNSMDEGFCIIEVIFDEHEKPVDFCFLEVNPSFEKKCGLHDAAGRRIRELIPNLEAHWFEIYGKVAQTGEPVRFVNQAKALESRWFDVYAFRIGEAGTRKVAVVFNNITDQRIVANSLVARAADLARADRSKDEFLAMLAHELRNPLAPLRNAGEILRVTGANAEERRQAHRILARQIENMTRMIDDLLDVSRITEGKIELRKEAVLLDAILTSAANLARPGIKGRGQEFAMVLPAEPVFLHADATRLEQVFGNLLGNASKYSDAGCHISLSAERAAAHGIEPPEVIVRVRDDGIGIGPELLPRIFDLFVQATRASDRTHGGLGIGLTLVKRLVALHGGRVEARSEGIGRGSEFIVCLPILPGPVVAPAPPVALQIRETSRRMLIVDDNEDSARSMSTLQRLRGHETRTAFTGPDAVTAAVEFLPEVVLLDIGLPGMDGFEVARCLRAMPALAGTFLVAMTGYGSVQDRARAREAGFDEYLVKPVDLDLLREWLRSRS